MTDDQFWRIVLGSGAIAVISIYREPIMRFLRRIGYRDWRDK